MAEPYSITRVGNQFELKMDDDETYLAVPTGKGIWLFTSAEDTPTPPTPPDPTAGPFVFPFPLTAFNPANGFHTPSRPTHDGIDFANGVVHEGDITTAAANGVVAEHVPYHPGWGNMVRLEHQVPGVGSVSTLYAHSINGSVVVSVGQTVVQGQKIGLVGNTGNSFGAHLHFETWQGTRYGTARNPITTIPEWNTHF